MQTKKQSLIEACTNTAIGFGISLAATFIIMPLMGFSSTPLKNIGMTLFFTVISIARSYLLRRFFNKKIKKIDYDEVAFTCIQLLENAAGAEFEDEHMAMDIIAETIEKA